MKITKSEAEYLIKDETFIKIFDIIKQEQVNLFLNTSSSLEDREDAHRMVRVLNKFERILKNVIVDEVRKEKRK